MLTVSRCGRSGWRDSTEQYLNNQLSSSATSLVSAQIHDAFSSADQSRRVKQDEQDSSGGQRKKRRLGVKKVKKFRRLHSYEDLRERDNVIKVAVAKKRRRNDDANNRKSDLMDDQKYYDNWVPTSLASYEQSQVKTRHRSGRKVKRGFKQNHHQQRNVNQMRGSFVKPLMNFLDAPLKTLISLPSKLGSAERNKHIDDDDDDVGVDYHRDVVNMFERKDDNKAAVDDMVTKIYNTQYAVSIGGDDEGAAGTNVIEPVYPKSTAASENDNGSDDVENDLAKTKHARPKKIITSRPSIHKRQAVSHHIPIIKQTSEMNKRTPRDFTFV